MVKVCIRCGEEKPLESYYRHPKMADGHLGKCAGCCREEARARREAKIEEIRAYDRRRGFRHPGGLRLSARNAVAKALAAGALLRRHCIECGATAEAHHPDYTRPLDVVWLCRPHHARAHRRVA